MTWGAIIGFVGIGGSLLTAAFWLGNWFRRTEGEARLQGALSDRVEAIDRIGTLGSKPEMVAVEKEVESLRRDFDRLEKRVDRIDDFVLSMAGSHLRSGGGLRFRSHERGDDGA